jgi:hypothetical protein
VTKLTRALNVLGFDLGEVGGLNEHVVFGSASLVLREIIDRSVGDLDVIVTRRVWGALLARPRWRWLTPKAGDPPILERPIGLAHEIPIHAFFDWHDPAVEIDCGDLLARAELVGDFWLAPVEDVLEHKRQAYACLAEFPQVAKHGPDIKAIERHLQHDAA